MLVAYTDRRVRCFRWCDADEHKTQQPDSNQQLLFDVPRGQFVLLQTWNLAGQVSKFDCVLIYQCMML